MREQTDDAIQCWTAKRRASLIMSILKGVIPEAARKHGLTVVYKRRIGTNASC